MSTKQILKLCNFCVIFVIVLITIFSLTSCNPAAENSTDEQPAAAAAALGAYAEKTNQALDCTYDFSVGKIVCGGK